MTLRLLGSIIGRIYALVFRQAHHFGSSLLIQREEKVVFRISGVVWTVAVLWLLLFLFRYVFVVSFLALFFLSSLFKEKGGLGLGASVVGRVGGLD